MPFFIIFNLLLSTLVFIDSPYLPLLINDAAIILGSVISVGSLLAGAVKKLSTASWHDGFACGALLIWYAYWQPQFAIDAPMFRFFPIYYALLAGWLTIGLVNKSARFDLESRETVRQLQKLARFDTRMIACLVLASLAFPEHYLSYPLVTTLFIVRFTMQRCLEIVDAEVFAGR